MIKSQGKIAVGGVKNRFSTQSDQRNRSDSQSLQQRKGSPNSRDKEKARIISI